MTTHRIDVRLPGREYPVLIGHGVVEDIAQFLPKSARKAVIITQEFQQILRYPSNPKP
jgi:3-dehydroquinate synthetase